MRKNFTFKVQSEADLDIQWGSEYQPFEKQTFYSSNFKWLGIQMVSLCNISYVLDRPFKYQTNTEETKTASICPVFKWLGCLLFKWHADTTPFSIQPLLNHFNTKFVRSPVYCILLIKLPTIPDTLLLWKRKTSRQKWSILQLLNYNRVHHTNYKLQGNIKRSQVQWESEKGLIWSWTCPIVVQPIVQMVSCIADKIRIITSFVQ